METKEVTKAKNKKTIDMSGMRFGYLTVLDKHYIENGKTYWLCRCDCGNLHYAQRSNLVNGGVRSCGKCLRKGQYKCPVCTKRIYPDQRFCPNCGNSTKGVF